MARVTARRVRGGLGVTSWALEQLGTGGHGQLTVKVVAAARIMIRIMIRIMVASASLIWHGTVSKAC